MSTSKLIGLAIITVITCAGAIIHGRVSHRWGTDDRMASAGSRLANIEQQLPGWSLVESVTINPVSRAMLESTGDVVRVYDDSISGARINVSIVVGPPGTISVHSPEVCLPSRNYKQLGQREAIGIRDAAGAEHQFWKVSFESQDVHVRTLHVYYAWSTGAAWSAPENPRSHFVGAPYLYKLQLASYVSPEDPSDDRGREFLSEFLPVVSTELVTATVPQTPSPAKD